MKGRVVPLATVWKLANAWYGDPRSPEWRARSRDENQRALASAGLTDEFWELPT